MGILIRPFFPLNMQVSVKLIYVLPRPNYHFVGKNRVRGVLKQEYLGRNISYYNKQGDVDNLMKFTLDSISGPVVLMNDKQVVRVESVKMFEQCNKGGMTVVQVDEWNETDVNRHAPVHDME